MKLTRKQLKCSEARGNAILVSLIIMASALSVGLGMASIVSGEIRNSGLVPQSERAYYKAESYIEQSLAYKKTNPNFNVPSIDKLYDSNQYSYGNPVVCVSEPCFSLEPRQQSGSNGQLDPNGLLKDYFATSESLNAGRVLLAQDQSEQFDVDTSDPNKNKSTATVSFTSSSSGDLQGLEVSIVAFPKNKPPTSGTCNVTPGLFCGAAQQNNLGLPGQSTPVFVDKKFFPGSGNVSFTIGSGLSASEPQEPYPPLDGYTYRLRIRPLGGDASLSAMQAVTPSGAVPLLLADFQVRAVAQDGQARRGIQVVAPAATEIAGVFDYVLFAELDINKLKTKAPAGVVVPPPPPAGNDGAVEPQ